VFATQERLDEFKGLCVRDPESDPPVETPRICRWIMEADRVIRANNAMR